MPVVVRYVELARDRIEVVAGRRFSVRVSTDALTYRWLFAGNRGIARRRVLVLRAPETPGEYRVRAVRGRADSAEVVVTEPEPSRRVRCLSPSRSPVAGVYML